MKTKKCKKCGEVKLVSDFHVTGKYKKTKVYKPDCKICANAKWKDRISTRIKECLEELGRTMECACCGRNGPVSGFDFHHNDPSQKDFAISSRWCISKDVLLREIKKCTILCCWCHRLTHSGDIPHIGCDQCGNIFFSEKEFAEHAIAWCNDIEVDLERWRKEFRETQKLGL